MKQRREIKFRVWQPDEKRMFYPLGLDDWQRMASVIDFHHLRRGTVLMQFTGLRDKNGKEIYEGDIVIGKWSPKDNNFLVKFIGAGFYFEPIKWSETKRNFGDVWRIHADDIECEVIGNIYENKELLEK